MTDNHKCKNMLESQKGFTLVEIIAVLVIFALGLQVLAFLSPHLVINKSRLEIFVQSIGFSGLGL